MHIRRLSVYRDLCGFAQLTALKGLAAIDRVVDLLAASREQSLIREVRIHRRIHDCQIAAVVDLDMLFIKAHIDKVIALFVIIQADTDRRNKRRILYNILFEEMYVV